MTDVPRNSELMLAAKQKWWMTIEPLEAWPLMMAFRAQSS